MARKRCGDHHEERKVEPENICDVVEFWVVVVRNRKVVICLQIRRAV